MKKLSFLTVFLLGMYGAGYSQIRGIALAKDGSLMLDRLYAGTINSIPVSMDSIHVGRSTSVRLGAKLDWHLTGKLSKWSLESFAFYQMNLGRQDFGFSRFYARYKSRRLELRFGNGPTAATLLRPHPISWAHHFESPIQSQMPNGGYIALARVILADNVSVGASIAHRADDDAEYSLALYCSNWKLAAWYRSREHAGAAFTYGGQNWNTTFVFKTGFVGSFTWWEVPQGENTFIAPYLNIGFNTVDGFEKQNLELGGFWAFKIKSGRIPHLGAQGRIGIGMDAVAGTINGMMQLALAPGHNKLPKK